MSYALLTPVRNEREALEALRGCIESQTLRPARWYLIDGASTDGTLEAINDWADSMPWIRVVSQQAFHGRGYSHLNFSQAMNEGLSAVREDPNASDLRFIGKTDATVQLDPRYFELLHRRLLERQNLAFACGAMTFRTGKRDIKLATTAKLGGQTLNDLRLYRREFLLDVVSGYPLTPSPDAVIAIKARNLGWGHEVVAEARAVDYRLGGAKIGHWRGGVLKGRTMYALGYHPLLMLANSAVQTVRLPPHTQMISMSYGYLSAALKREARVSDPEVREYYGSERLREILRNMFSLKGMR